MAKDILKVMTSTDGDEASIFLYDYIGMEYWWEETEDKDSTDIEFVRKLRELEKSHNTIHIRINSPGGSMKHGNAMVTAIQNSSAEIHTWNDGMAASMAADIWLAGKNRHMAQNALLMIHPPSTGVWGTAQELRAQADVLDKFEETALVILMQATGLSEEDARSQYYDGKDNWLTYKEANDANMITSTEEYEAENVDDSVTNLSYLDIMSRYKPKKRKAKLKFRKTKAVEADIVEPQKEEFDMQTIPEIVEAANSGKINKAQLLEALNTEKSDAERIAELTDKVENSANQVEQLIKQNRDLVAKLDATPAGEATTVAKTKDVADGPDDFEKKMLALDAAKKAELGVK